MWLHCLASTVPAGVAKNSTCFTLQRSEKRENDICRIAFVFRFEIKPFSKIVLCMRFLYFGVSYCSLQFVFRVIFSHYIPYYFHFSPVIFHIVLYYFLYQIWLRYFLYFLCYFFFLHFLHFLYHFINSDVVLVLL